MKKSLWSEQPKLSPELLSNYFLAFHTWNYWDKFTKKTYIKGRYPNLSSNPNLKIAAKTFRGCEKNIRLLAVPPFFRNPSSETCESQVDASRHRSSHQRRVAPLHTSKHNFIEKKQSKHMNSTAASGTARIALGCVYIIKSFNFYNARISLEHQDLTYNGGTWK